MDRCGHLGDDDDGWVVSIKGHWYMLCGDCATVLETLADSKLPKSEALTE